MRALTCSSALLRYNKRFWRRSDNWDKRLPNSSLDVLHGQIFSWRASLHLELRNEARDRCENHQHGAHYRVNTQLEVIRADPVGKVGRALFCRICETSRFVAMERTDKTTSNSIRRWTHLITGWVLAAHVASRQQVVAQIFGASHFVTSVIYDLSDVGEHLLVSSLNFIVNLQLILWYQRWKKDTLNVSEKQHRRKTRNAFMVEISFEQCSAPLLLLSGSLLTRMFWVREPFSLAAVKRTSRHFNHLEKPSDDS